MNERISDLLAEMQRLELELRKELADLPEESALIARARELGQNWKQEQRALRTSLLSYFRRARLLSVLTAPLVYSLILPLALLDLWATLYQQLCFRAYGIPRVKRADFVVVDRHLLPYLNLVEKLNCAYCGYGNGVIAYVREIASLTEQYWCPIKHATTALGLHHRYRTFVAHGDAAGFRDRLESLRDELRDSPSGPVTDDRESD
jgi:hypothetical protein